MNMIGNKNTQLLLGNSLQDIKKAAEILLEDGLVAVPTETVYGLAANALSKKAIAKVFAAKNRPFKNPLIIHVASIEQALECFDLKSANQYKERLTLLAKKFWPGPLTLVAPKAKKISKLATGGLDNVAVRIPDNEIALALLNLVKVPLVMPSANIATRPSPTNAQHVLQTLNGRIDAVLDGGVCRIGLESTVVKIIGTNVQILRQGQIDGASLALALGEEIENCSGMNEKEPQSPGQSFLHYSPAVKACSLAFENEITKLWPTGATIICLKKSFEHVYELGPRAQNALTIGLPDEATDCAPKIYEALYQAEKAHRAPLFILLADMEHKPEWQAIMDRIKRACAKK